jgi:hypothetical protein
MLYCYSFCIIYDILLLQRPFIFNFFYSSLFYYLNYFFIIQYSSLICGTHSSMPLLVLFSYNFWVPEGHPIDFQKSNRPFSKINSYFFPHPHTWLYDQSKNCPVHFFKSPRKKMDGTDFGIFCVFFFGA